MLKRKLGQQVITEPTLPPINSNGQFLVELIAILERRVVNKQNRAVPQVLVQWFKMTPEEATWEDYEPFNSTISYS